MVDYGHLENAQWLIEQSATDLDGGVQQQPVQVAILKLFTT